MSKSERSTEKRFRVLILVVALFGALLAVGADSSLTKHFNTNNYWDAAREIGGALVSGAVVAWLVVWFEDRREEDRVDRESTRDDMAAIAAWHREIDLRLNSSVRIRLAEARAIRLRVLESRTNPVTTAPGVAGSGPALEVALGEVDTLVDLLPDSPLGEAWQDWKSAFSDFMHVPPPKAGGSLSKPQRDPELHDEGALQEGLAWTVFTQHLTMHISAKYEGERPVAQISHGVPLPAKRPAT